MSLRQGGREGPLQGITVIDLTRALSGPYATLLLADQGARVIKVEDPQGGDDSRHVPPFVGNKSVYFSSINRDKESIALDLKNAGDRLVFDELLSHADVLVENFRPGVMKRLGYDWDSIREKYPQLVMASISGFGQNGPYASRAAYDMVIQAMGGIMSITGEEDGRPVRVGISISDLSAGLFATIGVQGALLQRIKTQKGSHVDISMLDCQVSLLENAVARHLATGELPRRVGSRHPTITPFDVYEAQDGFMAICVGNETQFGKLMKIIGRAELADDVRFGSIAARNDNEQALKVALDDALKGNPRSFWFRQMEEAGIPGGPINGIGELVKDPQIVGRNMIVEVHDPQAGTMRFAATPVKISSQPVQRRHRAAPDLDADRAHIVAELRQVASLQP